MTWGNPASLQISISGIRLRTRPFWEYLLRMCFDFVALTWPLRTSQTFGRSSLVSPFAKAIPWGNFRTLRHHQKDAYDCWRCRTLKDIESARTIETDVGQFLFCFFAICFFFFKKKSLISTTHDSPCCLVMSKVSHVFQGTGRKIGKFCFVRWVGVEDNPSGAPW